MLSEVTYTRKKRCWLFANIEFDSKQAARLMRLATEGGPELAERVKALLERYPQLGDRPLKAGEAVADGRVWFVNEGELIAQVETDRADMPTHEVHLLHVQNKRRWTCTCEDFKLNLFAIPTPGGYQQLCKHVLAVALAGWEKYGEMLVLVRESGAAEL
ncbi:MAG: SWIM zinc finger domain-containing protein [Nitrososphaera sp.]|nr:SWIM zinc finger domain-containing protein [Nitrososphaera sp.]